jgi:Iron-containing redox enzyme
MQITIPNQKIPTLQKHYWPSVNSFVGFNKDFAHFLSISPDKQHCLLNDLRKDIERHGQFLHDSLASVYDYYLGYRNSSCFLKTDENLERQLLNAKLTLEAELIENVMHSEPIPERLSQREAAEYLNILAIDNSGISHPLFDYLKNAPRKIQLCFAQHELMRNEVVDDEVSLLVAGLQGLLKIVTASNLWDECGRGKLVYAHTYWLRRMLEATDWQELKDYRQNSPWFSKITSNLFMMLLTRPGFKLSAYGYFLISESAVAPHFEKILIGLNKAGLTQEDITIYFNAHLKIDKYHGQELVDAVRYQEPSLIQQEIDLLLWGAHVYIAASTTQYDRMLTYLSSLELVDTIN